MTKRNGKNRSVDWTGHRQLRYQEIEDKNMINYI